MSLGPEPITVSGAQQGVQMFAWDHSGQMTLNESFPGNLGMEASECPCSSSAGAPKLGTGTLAGSSSHLSPLFCQRLALGRPNRKSRGQASIQPRVHTRSLQVQSHAKLTSGLKGPEIQQEKQGQGQHLCSFPLQEAWKERGSVS